MKPPFKHLIYLGLFLGSPVTAQTTWIVDATGTAPGSGTPADPYTRVDYAVAQASTISGDLVFVKPGTYQDEAIDFAGKDLHVFTRGATLRNTPPSPGMTHPPSLVTMANGETSACILEGFTLMGAGGNLAATSIGGSGPAGSGIWISGASPVIRDCTFTRDNSWDWTALVGGGIYISNGSVPGQAVRIEACVFEGLRTHGGGAALYLEESSVVLADCVIEGGYAPAGAGLFSLDSELEMLDVEFVGNNTGQLLDRGCHAYVVLGSLTMNGCTSREAQLGAWVVRDAQLSVQDSLFENNYSPNGSPCFALSGCQAVFEDCQFLGNSSDQGGSGGAIFATVGGALQVRECHFEGNAASAGGAILVRGTTATLHVSDSTFSNNTSVANANSNYRGGGAINTDAPTTVERCTFNGNLATAASGFDSALGGAMAVWEPCHVSDSQFIHNEARTLDAVWPFSNTAAGGAVKANAPVTLERCLIQGNSVSNSTFDGAGALSGMIEAIHCTLRGNRSEGGGPSAMGSGSLTNSIVWDADMPVLSPAVTASYSIVQGGASGIAVLDLDPQFWGADDSHLMPGSPAINAGDPNSALDADGSIADLGAYPFDGTYCGPGCTGEIGTVTCVAQPNSTGAASTLTALGSSVVAEDLLILHSSGLPTDVFGFFLTSQNSGFTPGLGGGQGVLCLGPPVLLRFNQDILFSGAGGTVTQRERLTDFPMNTTVQAGESWHFQLWHRDMTAGGLPTSNTSPAVRVDF